MKAYGVKSPSHNVHWLLTGKSSYYGVRSVMKNGTVKNQLRRNMKRAERQCSKHDIRMELV